MATEPSTEIAAGTDRQLEVAQRLLERGAPKPQDETASVTGVKTSLVDEYARGRTPIPCVRCNSFTKFRDLLAHADALDCRYLATGHYVVARDGALYRGEDRGKDQSYFLWGIDRAVVARMLTPVGASTKEETRAIARLHPWRVVSRTSSRW